MTGEHGGDRTRMSIARGILSAERLPVPPRAPLPLSKGKHCPGQPVPNSVPSVPQVCPDTFDCGPECQGYQRLRYLPQQT
jgi:hypothetical protein